MKNPRNKRQIYDLALQLSPFKPSYIVESFTKATMLPYSYMLIDCHQETPPLLLLRSDIFPDDNQPVKCFVEKG